MKNLFTALLFVLVGTAGVAQAREAIVNCQIEYVGPDGATRLSATNQKFYVPLSPGMIYFVYMPVGDRRLDVIAEGAGHDGYSLTIRLWKVTSAGTLCEQTVGGERTASCLYDSRRNEETANIQCVRLQ